MGRITGAGPQGPWACVVGRRKARTVSTRRDHAREKGPFFFSYPYSFWRSIIFRLCFLEFQPAAAPKLKWAKLFVGAARTGHAPHLFVFCPDVLFVLLDSSFLFLSCSRALVSTSSLLLRICQRRYETSLLLFILRWGLQALGALVPGNPR